MNKRQSTREGRTELAVGAYRRTEAPKEASWALDECERQRHRVLGGDIKRREPTELTMVELEAVAAALWDTGPSHSRPLGMNDEERLKAVNQALRDCMSNRATKPFGGVEADRAWIEEAMNFGAITQDQLDRAVAHLASLDKTAPSVAKHTLPARAFAALDSPQLDPWGVPKL